MSVFLILFSFCFCLVQFAASMHRLDQIAAKNKEQEEPEVQVQILRKKAPRRRMTEEQIMTSLRESALCREGGYLNDFFLKASRNLVRLLMVNVDQKDICQQCVF